MSQLIEKDEDDFLFTQNNKYNTQRQQPKKNFNLTIVFMGLFVFIVLISYMKSHELKQEKAESPTVGKPNINEVTHKNVQSEKSAEGKAKKKQFKWPEPNINSQSSHIHPLERFKKFIPVDRTKLSQILIKHPQKLPLNILQISQQRVQQTLKSLEIIEDNIPEDELQKKLFIGFNLAMDPYNAKYMQAQYYLLNQKYHLDERIPQIPICVVATGRNNDEFFHSQYDSILRQNYTNYRIILVDDFSDSIFPKLLKDYIRKLPQKYQQRTVFIQNQQRKYALYNRYSNIKKHCSAGELVLDLDLDDWLIGRQVFNFLNHRFHSNGQLWLFYSNLLSSVESRGITHKPVEFYPQQIIANNSFREWGYFKTSQLRVYKFELFNKIDQKDFIDSQGKYYRWNSDMFMQYPMMEMACSLHCEKLEQFFYFYNYNLELSRPRYSQIHQKKIVQTLIPYEKLQSLEQMPKRKQFQPDLYSSRLVKKLLQKMVRVQVDWGKVSSKKVNLCVIMGLEMQTDLEEYEQQYLNSAYNNTKNYKFINFATIQMDPQTNIWFNQKYNYLKHIQKIKYSKEFAGSIHYEQIIRVVQDNCQGYQYAVFSNSLPKQGGLEKIGNIMRTNNIWVLYGSTTALDIEILAVKKSFLQQIYGFDLSEQNVEILKNNYQFLVVSILQLSNGHALKIDKQAYFEKETTGLLSLEYNINSRNIFFGYKQYVPLDQID